ncbi:MAG: SDR family oxidoreductase [Kiritimatiellae bacterium]|jgi:S-adenosylmethionine synthetase|nr:SDR family oxidoreductase [Kiritimatiellia bacterium]
MTAKNILVTGASGLLGRPILKSLKEIPEWNVTGTAYSRATENLTKVDLADLDNLSNFLDGINPDIIVHSAAERRPDVSQKDPEGTERLNVGTTAKIAEWAAANNAFMVYISTDYVFDGTAPPYTPESSTKPLNSYGKSKLAGEFAVVSATLEYAILRVPILYGDVEYIEESAALGIVKNIINASDGEKIKAENWAIRHPTLTDDVADIIQQMLLLKEKDPSFNGIFHWSGNEAMTKYDMAKIFAQYLNFDESRIIPDNNPPAGAPRPQNSKLNTSCLTSKGIEKYTPFKNAIPLILQDILDRRVKSEG